MKMHRVFGWLALPVALVACGDDGGSTTTFGDASVSITVTDTSVDTTSGSSSTTESTESQTGESTAGPTTSPTGSSSESSGSGSETTGTGGTAGLDEPCLKVDVILAIDSSTTMQSVVDELQVIFNSWVGKLLNDVGDGGIMDFQLAIIDGCDQTPYYHDTHNQNGACNFSTGNNYMISSSPNLGAEFTCVSNTNDSNYQGMPDSCSGDEDDENMGLAAGQAVTFPAATGENAGFLRDDAVLFVVVVTNEDEGGYPFSMADPQLIYDLLLQSKLDEVNNIVFLGIGGNPGVLPCTAYGELTYQADKLKELTAMFEADGRGLFWDLCNENLQQAFDDAIDIVDSACDDFVEPQ